MRASNSRNATLNTIRVEAETLFDFIKQRNHRTVDTVAALRLLDKTKYTRAFVLGDAAPGDGGGGSYWFDVSDTTTADNGVTVIVAVDGGRWKLTRYNGGLSSLNDADANGNLVPGVGHFSGFDMHRRKRPVPSGMAWLPFEVLGFKAMGGIAISKTGQQILDAVATLPNALTTTHYLDAVIGSDAYAGNIAQPFQTLAQFLSVGSYRAQMSVGDYEPADIRRDSTSGNRVRRFYGSGKANAEWLDTTKKTIVRVAGDTAQSLTWTAPGTPNVNQAVLVTSNEPIAVTMGRVTDEHGRPKPLTKQASAADVASLGGWYYDSGTQTLSVRYGQTADFDANVKPQLDIIYKDANAGRMLIYGAECYFENICFVGVYPWLLYGLGGKPIAVFKNCSFWFSATSGVVNDGGDAYFIDCEIYRCYGDGVGSHASGGSEARHALINTNAYYAGDIDTYGVGASNQNGASSHENGCGVVIGGEIKKSCGPNLIDTGSGPGSTGVSWWLGVHAEESVGANQTNFETYGVRTVWMESCTETGDAGNPVVVSDTGTVLRHSANAVRGYTSNDLGSGAGDAVGFDVFEPV